MGLETTLIIRVPAGKSTSKENKIAGLKRAVLELRYQINPADIAEAIIRKALIQDALSETSLVQLEKNILYERKSRSSF